MAAIRNKDTKPELIVRRYLWKTRISLSQKRARPSRTPDIVLRKYRGSDICTRMFLARTRRHEDAVDQFRILA